MLERSEICFKALGSISKIIPYFDSSCSFKSSWKNNNKRVLGLFNFPNYWDDQKTKNSILFKYNFLDGKYETWKLKKQINLKLTTGYFRSKEHLRRCPYW